MWVCGSDQEPSSDAMMEPAGADEYDTFSAIFLGHCGIDIIFAYDKMSSLIPFLATDSLVVTGSHCWCAERKSLSSPLWSLQHVHPLHRFILHSHKSTRSGSRDSMGPPDIFPPHSSCFQYLEEKDLLEFFRRKTLNDTQRTNGLNPATLRFAHQ